MTSFRDLKKNRWVCRMWYFDSNDGEDYDNILEHTVAKPILYSQHEYDNGLYLEYQPYERIISWKDLKYNIKKYHPKIVLYNGKCNCGKTISYEEYKNAMDNICKECWDKKWMEMIFDGDME